MKGLKTLILTKLAITGTVSALLCGVAAAQPAYTLIQRSSQARDTVPLAINNLNQIVGYWTDGLTYHATGFLYEDGTFTDVQVPGATDTFITGNNDAGVMAGYYYKGDGAVHGFVYDGTTFTTIDRPGYQLIYLNGINNANVAVGYAQTSEIGSAVGFLYDNGTFTDINFPGANQVYPEGINNNGDISGSFSTYVALKAFLLTTQGARRVIQPPTNASNVYVGKLNDSRFMVGSFTLLPPQPFLLRHGSVVLFTLPSRDTGGYAYGVNNADYIVGTFQDFGITLGYLRVP